MDFQQQIQQLIAENSSLSLDEVTDINADLYAQGLSSLDCVRVLLAVEDELDIELPSESIDREMFASVANLMTVVNKSLSAAA